MMNQDDTQAGRIERLALALTTSITAPEDYIQETDKLVEWFASKCSEYEINEAKRLASAFLGLENANSANSPQWKPLITLA